MVTEADPDAPLRQGRRLEDGDTDSEQRVMRDVWKLLRAGAMDDAQALCRAAGMSWLAASIGAGLWDDPQLRDEKKAVSGTQSLDLWLDICSRISNEEAVYSFERAVFGSLCGNLSAMKLVCASWADQLWASYKHRAHFALQRELHKHNFTDVMEKFHPPTDSAAADRAAAEPEQAIYDALSRSDTKMEVRREANEPYHVVQGLVILNQIPTTLRTLADWAKRIEGGRSICPPQLLRFATHLILFLDEMRELGTSGSVPSFSGVEDARSTIIGAYIKHLVAAGHGTWVAFYTARLPGAQQVETYVEFLATLKHTDNAALSRAKEAGLDAKAIALCNATRATSAPVNPIRGMPMSGNALLTAEEEERIRAVEWLSVSPTWLYDLLLQINKLARAFMLEGRASAMEALFSASKPLIPSEKRNLFELENLNSPLPDSERTRKLNACKEHRGYELYMKAQRAVQEWKKPAEVWSDRDQQLFLGAYSALREVLVTQGCARVGGWMKDVDEADDEGEAQREEQMQQIRVRCIPAICFTLHHLCMEAKRLKESVLLASIIVDEELHENFPPEELQQLLRQIGNSVVELLRDAPDGRLPL